MALEQAKPCVPCYYGDHSRYTKTAYSLAFRAHLGCPGCYAIKHRWAPLDKATNLKMSTSSVHSRDGAQTLFIRICYENWDTISIHVTDPSALPKGNLSAATDGSSAKLLHRPRQAVLHVRALRFINPCHIEFIFGNMHFYFLYFLNTQMTKVVDMLPWGRQGPIHPA